MNFELINFAIFFVDRENIRITLIAHARKVGHTKHIFAL